MMDKIKNYLKNLFVFRSRGQMVGLKVYNLKNECVLDTNNGIYPEGDEIDPVPGLAPGTLITIYNENGLVDRKINVRMFPKETKSEREIE